MYKTQGELFEEIGKLGWTFEHPGYLVKILNDKHCIGISNENIWYFEELVCEPTESYPLEDLSNCKLIILDNKLREEISLCIEYLHHPIGTYWGELWENPEGSRLSNNITGKSRIDIDISWFDHCDDEHAELRELTMLIHEFIMNTHNK